MNKWFLSLLLVVAYLPFQAALNLAPDVDLMTGRVLILGLFGAWAVKEAINCRKSSNCYREHRRSGAKDFSQIRDAPSGEILPPSGRGQNDRICLKNNCIFWLLTLFFLLSAISIFGAENQIWGLRKLLVFISVFPLFLLVGALIKNKKDARTFIHVIVGGAAISALIVLAQFLAQFVSSREAVMNFWALRVTPIFSGASFGALVAANPSWLVNIGGQTIMRAIGLFPDPHMLSFYLGLTLPFSLALFVFDSRRHFALFIINCLLLIILLLTFSRGGYLGLIISLSVFFYLARPRLDKQTRRFFSALLLIAVIILIVFGWPVVGRLFSSFDLAEGSNMGRMSVWQDSWAIIKKNPIIGVGLGNYPSAISLGQNYRSAVTSHNLYLDIWAETGILGLASWLMLVLAAAGKAYRQRKNDPVLSVGSLSALTYFSVHSFFETAIFNPTVLSVFMIVIGLTAIGYE